MIIHPFSPTSRCLAAKKHVHNRILGNSLEVDAVGGIQNSFIVLLENYGTNDVVSRRYFYHAIVAA